MAEEEGGKKSRTYTENERRVQYRQVPTNLRLVLLIKLPSSCSTKSLSTPRTTASTQRLKERTFLSQSLRRTVDVPGVRLVSILGHILDGGFVPGRFIEFRWNLVAGLEDRSTRRSYDDTFD